MNAPTTITPGNGSKSRSALIVDPSFPLFELSEEITPLVVQNADKAIQYLSDSETQFGGIYLHPILTPPGVLALIRLAHQNHAATPIYILQDGSSVSNTPFTAQEMNRLAIQGTVEGKSPLDLLAKLAKPIIPFEEKTAPSLTETEAKEFLPIPIHRFAFTFQFSSKLFFDVYIRMREDKYLKILPAGSSMPEEQLLRYIHKGVTHLYFRRANHHRCIEYCEILEKTFLTHPGLSPAVKISAMMNKSYSTLEILQKIKTVQEKELESILAFVDDVRRLLAQLNLDKVEDIQALVQNISNYEHALGTTVLAITFATLMDLEQEKSVEILGLAAFLHDVGLTQMPASFQTEDLTQMSRQEAELFIQHPVIGAQILQETGLIHPVAIQVVAQHHERRNGAGFPNKLSGQELHKLTEVVSFSEELTRLIQARRGQNLFYILQEMESKSKEQFSLPMMNAFKNAFRSVIE